MLHAGTGEGVLLQLVLRGQVRTAVALERLAVGFLVRIDALLKLVEVVVHEVVNLVREIGVQVLLRRLLKVWLLLVARLNDIPVLIRRKHRWLLHFIIVKRIVKQGRVLCTTLLASTKVEEIVPIKH